jgi:hypothetical protein
MCRDGSGDAILSCIIHCNGKNKNHFYAFYVMNKRRKSLASNVSKTYIISIIVYSFVCLIMVAFLLTDKIKTEADSDFNAL